MVYIYSTLKPRILQSYFGLGERVERSTLVCLFQGHLQIHISQPFHQFVFRGRG